MPATPTRITSLAPSTRPEDLVPAMVESGIGAVAAYGTKEVAAARRIHEILQLSEAQEEHFLSTISTIGRNYRVTDVTIRQELDYWRPRHAFATITSRLVGDRPEKRE